MNAERWDTGVEARVGVRPLSFAVAVTQGTLSHPELEDDNGGKQVSARLAWTPVPAFVAGVSGASGDFVADAARAALPGGDGPGQYRQQALGFDLEWSAGHLILRGEAIFSRWRLAGGRRRPASRTRSTRSARSSRDATSCAPGVYVASRVERLTMAEIASERRSAGLGRPGHAARAGRRLDAPRRHVLLKASWQHNWRDGGRVRENDLVAAQVLLWY